MRNYIAVVFASTDAALEGLHGLWSLDAHGNVSVHEVTVVHRDATGQLLVDAKETYPALVTTVGAGVGMLLGLFAGGPVGIAVGLAAGAGIGAAALGAVGALADLKRASTRMRAMHDTREVLAEGQSVLIADVSETTDLIDITMRTLGGEVHRRPKSRLRDSSWPDADPPWREPAAQPALSLR